MSPTVRRTAIGALVGGGLFLLAALYQSLRAGGELLQYVAPAAALVVIGATVGALLGPLLGRIGSRRPEAADEDGGPGDAAASGGPDGRVPVEEARPDAGVETRGTSEEEKEERT